MLTRLVWPGTAKGCVKATVTKHDRHEYGVCFSGGAITVNSYGTTVKAAWWRGLTMYVDMLNAR